MDVSTRNSLAAALGLVVLTACGARTSLREELAGSGGETTAGSATTSSHASSGSGCVDEVIAKDVDGASALAVDGDTVFWGTIDGSVQRRLGNDSQTLVTNLSAVIGLTFDQSRVYYNDSSFVSAVLRKGGGQTKITDFPTNPVALTVDANGLYILDRGSGIAAGRVLRIGPDGMPNELITQLDLAPDFAADADAIYVDASLALVGGQAVSGPLLRVPKMGGPSVLLAQGLKEPAGLTVDADNVYFIEQVGPTSDLHGGLRKVSKAGGTVTTIATTEGLLPIDVAVDDKNAYVTTLRQVSGGFRGELTRFALDGSSSTVLSGTDNGQYTHVRLNESAIFWTIAWQPNLVPTDGASVRKKCK